MVRNRTSDTAITRNLMRTKVYKNLSSAMTVCFWCNQPKGEIVPLDNEWGSEPFVVDYKPCNKCLKRWKYGIVIIETTMSDPGDGRQKINETSWPTGRIFVLTPKWARKILPEKFVDSLKKGQVIYAGRTAFQTVLDKEEKYGKGPKSSPKSQDQDDETGNAEESGKGTERRDR